MLRYQKGMRTPRTGPLNLRYVQFEIPEGSSDWSGVRLNLAWLGGRLVVDLITQVALFDRMKSEWVHLTDKEMEAGAMSLNPNLETNIIRIYARSMEDRDRIRTLLESKGIAVGRLDDMSLPAGMFDGNDLSVEVTFTINKGIRRCVAKYSFNFLALVQGSAFCAATRFRSRQAIHSIWRNASLHRRS